MLRATVLLLCVMMLEVPVADAQPEASPALPTPDWVKNLVIYEVATKGFTSPNGPESGTFCSLEQKLLYLRELGVNALWLTGHSLADPKHFYGIWTQYACIEPQRFDPSLGTAEDFKRLVDQAHAQGIRIILDVISHGVMNDSLLVKQHPEWFKGGTWGMTDYHWAGRVKALDDWWVELWTRMAVDYGVDGYRIDCGLQGRKDLYRRIAQNAAAAGHPILILGEFDCQPEATHGVQGRPSVYAPQHQDHPPAEEWLNVGALLARRGQGPDHQSGVPGEWDVITYSCHDCGWEGFPAERNPYMNDDFSRWSLGYTALLAPAIPIFMAGEEFSARYVPLPRLRPDLFGKQERPGRWLYGSWLQWAQLKEERHRAMLADTRRMLAIRHAEADLLRSYRVGDPQRRIMPLVMAEAGGVRCVPYMVWNERRAIVVCGNERRDHDATLTVILPREKMGWPPAAAVNVRDLWSGKTLMAERKQDRLQVRVPVPRDGIPGGGLAVLRIERR